MSFEGSTLVDWAAYAQARAELGAGFVRILGYFREDGIKSVSAIEHAMRANTAAALVIPAHTLKGEARQFGAEPLAMLAETIEEFARDCVERHETCEEALEHVVRLRPLFFETLRCLSARRIRWSRAARPAGSAAGWADRLPRIRTKPKPFVLSLSKHRLPRATPARLATRALTVSR